MFKVYYKGQIVSEQEFATKKEAKNAIVPMLAGQQGKTVDELLGEMDGDNKALTIVGYYSHDTGLTPTTRVCPICGKTFCVKSEKSQQKVCSKECRKLYLREYNKNFRAKRIANDEVRQRNAKSNRKATKKYIARNRWQRRVDLADKIMTLAQEPNGRNLIATFLDKEVIAGGKRGGTNNQFRCEEEVSAEQEYLDAIARIDLLTQD